MVVPQSSQLASARIEQLCQELLSQRRLILVSNRGPVEYHLANDGSLQGRRGNGGVVTALVGVSKHADLTWVAAAMSEADRQAAEMAQGKAVVTAYQGHKMAVRFVVAPRSTYHKYYNIFCNPLLWFLQHYMWNPPHTPNISASIYDAWENGYVPVNQAFADAVAEESAADETPPLVMIHDYQLYLCPGLVRQQLPQAIIHHFVHIPWPEPNYWRLLPALMRLSIHQHLCAADIVGFQTVRDVRNFLHTCEAFLEGAEVDYREATIWCHGHLTTVRAYPISVDVAGLKHLARSPRVREYEEQLRAQCGEQTIVRVDRVEPSKNITRGFRAFDLFLERYPQFQGKVKFLAFLVPSRGHIRQYERYLEEVQQQVASLNDKYGPTVDLFYENNYPQAIAALRLYDVLLVNAVIDGMNLVAKEGPVVNTKDGVLILSETTGAYQQLGPHALGVSPADIEGTVQALYAALTMAPEERRERATALRQAVEREDLTVWLCSQLEDLAALT